MTMRIVTVAVAYLVLVTACAAQNIHPDPSFEATGEVGAARTGERALRLSVDAQIHWKAVGGAIEVEPFARYRVTEWVNATGTVLAPYCYQWNSYEWAFETSARVANTGGWVQSEVTFVSPTDEMVVHPLAVLDAANVDAWVDDIVIEKIAEPEQVIAEFEAAQPVSAYQQQLLARWYVQHGQLERADALMAGASGLARADIATVLARATDRPRRRMPYLAEVVGAGGPTYHQGVETFRALREGLTWREVMAAAARGLRANPTSDRAAKAFAALILDDMDYWSGSGDGLMTVNEAERTLDIRAGAVENIRASLPEGSVAQREVNALMDRFSAMRTETERRRQTLGTCTVKVGGTAITGESHVIVIPDGATAQEQFAARDLRFHLELITGGELPIRREGSAAGRTPIYVGRCRATRDAGIDLDGLGVEGVHIRTAGPVIYLGGNTRGALYATYVFLEEYLGCRWFTPECSTWPTEGTIDLATIDHRYIPPLEYRATDYPRTRPWQMALRNRFNGQSHSLTEQMGGKISYRGFVHTFSSLVPPSKYFAAHPEYYSEIRGKRVGSEPTQLCLTNPDVLDIATETVRQWIREAPDAEIISVSQNDCHGYCECEKCTALAEAEGSQAGPLLHFVNAIAERIERDHPNVAIDTLAYQYTRKPPKHVVPRHNVIVRLCSIECCFLHPLATDPYNAAFVEDIRGWNEICDRLHIWDYVINYRHSICPFPNLRVLKPNISFFIDHGVTGIYEEACYYTPGSELQELRGYIVAKTLWDPDYDTDQAIREFCDAYYEAAGPFIREYLDLIHNYALGLEDTHMRIYSNPGSYLTQELMVTAADLFDRAEAAVADDETVLHRVQVARLPVVYAQIALATGDSFAEQDGKLVQNTDVSIAELADFFERVARKEGITRVAEGGPTPKLDEWLDSLPRTDRTLQVHTLSNGSLQVDVLPAMGGRVWRIRTLPEGGDVLWRAGEEGAWQPASSGYEEYSEAGYRSPGWSEQYEVTDQGDLFIEMSAGLRNGLRLTRRVELVPDAPTLSITSTLSNPGTTARDGCLRAHPQFRVGDIGSAVLVSRAGGRQTIELARPDDPDGEFETWLRGEEMPRGEWWVVDRAADLAVICRFQPEEVSQMLLNWSGRQDRVNLELYSKQRSLGAGDSISLHQQWEVRKGLKHE